MNSKILSLLVFSIFLLSSVSAMTVYADFTDLTQSKIITLGNSVSFNVDFVSMNPPMTIKAGVYDSNNNLIYSFLNSNTNSKSYSNVYSYTPSTAGSYEIRVTGTDSVKTADSEILILKVNSQVSGNTPPRLNSIPNQQINEGNFYNYQTVASDGDNDVLTYTISRAPAGFAINSNGLISGVAPFVNSNTNYNIIVGVSDGFNPIVTQSYFLTVLASQNPNNLPTITVISPEENGEYNSDSITLRVSTDMPANVGFSLDSASIIEMNNPSDNIFTYKLNDLFGKHLVTFYIINSNNNAISPGTTVRFTMEKSTNHVSNNIIPGNFYQNNRYYDQFGNRGVIYNTSPITQKYPSAFTIDTLTLFYFLIGTITLGIFITIFILFRLKRRYY